MNRLLIVCTLSSLLMVPLAARGEDPFFPFPPGPNSTIDAGAQGWHTEFEENGDYGENWFLVVRTDGDAFLVVLLSVTNLGLRTFDAALDVHYYRPREAPLTLHREFRRKDIRSLAPEDLDLQVGTCRLRGNGRATRLTIDEPGFSLKLIAVNTLAPYQFGSGRVLFFADRSAQWNLGMMAPRADVDGTLEAEGRSHAIRGVGYFDHSWSTVKVPTILQRWTAVRIYDPKYTVILQQQELTERFGGEVIRFGLVGTEKEVIGPTRDFRFEFVETRKEEVSGRDFPTEIGVRIRTGGYTLGGTIKEQSYLESIDVLSQVSWPVRTAIKALYTNPYMLRAVGRYELDVVDREGGIESISGLALYETDYY